MSKVNIPQLVSILKDILPIGFNALHEPNLKGNELKYVTDCIESGWVSSVGSYVDLFEEKLAEFTGMKKAIVVVNGTAALHMCLKLVGVIENDEVLIPTLTFVATANAVTYCGAIPHFVDSEEESLGIDPIKLDAYLEEITIIRKNECFNKLTGRRIKALVPMHTFGHPVNIELLVKIAEKYHLELVEDAAESLGSYYKGIHTGNFGKIAALSFNGNKIVTTGGGGAILTNDLEIAKMAKHITTTAKIPHKWDFIHDCIGYNYRLPNINAAIGVAQLENIDYFLTSKRKLANQYIDRLSNVQGLSVYKEQEFSESNYWLNTILLDINNIYQRDEILTELNNQGIMSRPVWKSLHTLEMYKDCPRMSLEGAELLEKRIINIPSSVLLGEK
ncbi:LegC family aminotransferase [Bacillus sp. RG28]|uniref:LegC family aminotransferase n=1 Tax=Gottfriedia endophytica TaxID=2820819 RepID=A0A940NS04_9BACI|nr:LegC family aminotransferase [Gottfriedia endophytica]MBP0726735.1 LegC family aminotransferase [Gottfriedia endophytica]